MKEAVLDLFPPRPSARRTAPRMNEPNTSQPAETPDHELPGIMPVETADAPDRVAAVLARLTERILAGDFEPYGLLPPEGELAKSYRVSRTVVREAMRTLRAQGLVEMSRGRRPRVKAPDAQAAISSLEMLLRRNRASLLHLVEVRRPFESEIAALAAERATAEHIRQLERAVHDLAGARTLNQRIEADVRFHRVLAEATGNPVFVLLLETLSGFQRESREKTLAYSGMEIAMRGHRVIFEAVRARDSGKARHAMQEHLRLAARDLHQLGSQPSPLSGSRRLRKGNRL
jgi:GntR family transcriptional regulator, transcriptional repressor for pyruvate dehydrogenase complex